MVTGQLSKECKEVTMNLKHIIITAVILLLMCSTASAWLSGYANRMQIDINNTGDVLTHYPYNFTVNTQSLTAAGKMDADGKDCRITNSSDVLLNWWNDSEFNSTSTKIWVNTSSLGNTTNTTQYIYYGKSGDTYAGNGTTTFDFFDDFNRANSATVGNGWLETGSANISSNTLSASLAEPSTISRTFGFSGGSYAAEFNVKMSAHNKLVYNVVDDGTVASYLTCAQVAPDGLDVIMSCAPTNSLLDPFSIGTWYLLSNIRIDSTHYHYMIDYGAINSTYNQAPTTGSSNADNFSIYVASVAIHNVDNARIRKYVNDQPVSYLGIEESWIPISISTPSPGVSTIKYVSNKTITYSATPSRTADNRWGYGNGTFIEWDNSTISPSLGPLWINTSDIKYFNISLTSYTTGNNSDHAAESWNNSITDDLFDSTNYSWARWDELNLKGWIGYTGNIEVGDVDNDGGNEIIVVGSIAGSAVNNRDMIFYDTDGTKTQYADITSTNYQFTEASVHDVTEDSINEMLCIFGKTNTPPDGISDLYRFNTSGLNGSNLNNDIMTSGSNNPKSISWIDVDNDEHYYSSGCGNGETVNCYTTLSSHSASEIDDFTISAEDNLAWDIDNDGEMELLVVEGWVSGSAKIWMYEINNATGAYTSKTMLFDNNSIGGTHFSCGIHTGDIDNDGIDNLIIHWLGATACYASSYRIEAYEFDNIPHYGEGNFSESIVIDTTTHFCSRGHGKTFVADVDNDGLYELVTGAHTVSTTQPYPLVVNSYDITANGASITKNELVNCSMDYMGNTTYNVQSITPAFISRGKFVIAVQKERENAASLETEIYVLESVNQPPNDIAIGAHQHGMLRKNITASETFSTIAVGIAHDVCYTWWDSTNDLWESYTVGRSYNAGKSVPEHDSYFVLMDGTGTTISCNNANAETVAVPVGWYATYLRGATNKTLTVIKADMGGNCHDLYAFNTTAGAWTSAGAYSVQGNQGLLVNASAGFNWDGEVP
jgi:hypothetical protein